MEVISVIFKPTISLSRIFSSSENDNHMSIFPKAKYFQIVNHRWERGKKWIFTEEVTLDLVCPDWVRVCQMKKRKQRGDRKRLSRGICKTIRSRARNAWRRAEWFDVAEALSYMEGKMGVKPQSGLYLYLQTFGRNAKKTGNHLASCESPMENPYAGVWSESSSHWSWRLRYSD